MITSKDLFIQIREEEEYAICMMSMNTYNELHQKYENRIALTTVKNKTNRFANDEVYKQLKSDVNKASSKLIKYEQENK